MKDYPHFTFLELIASTTAQENHVSNVPIQMEHVENLVCLAQFLEEIREEFGHPIVVNSGFRSPVINHKVGGVKNSRHLVGRAADIRPDYIPSNEYRWNFQRLVDVLKSHEDELSELLVKENYIHLAI